MLKGFQTPIGRKSPFLLRYRSFKTMGLEIAAHHWLYLEEPGIWANRGLWIKYVWFWADFSITPGLSLLNSLKVQNIRKEKNQISESLHSCKSDMCLWFLVGCSPGFVCCFVPWGTCFTSACFLICKGHNDLDDFPQISSSCKVLFYLILFGKWENKNAFHM